MFLGIKEMKYAKLRYLLIMGVMFLVAYVAFMLSGLAYGLSQGNRLGVDNWQASGVILSDDANKNLMASSLTMTDLADVEATNKAALGQYAGALMKTIDATDEDKRNISLFGVEQNSFLMPNLIAGHTFAAEGEIIIPENLAAQGFQLGDEVYIGKWEQPLKIVGITQKNTFSVVPLIYTSLDQWQEIKFGQRITGDNTPINAIIIKDQTIDSVIINPEASDKLIGYDIETFINKLPGYQEQKLTLNAMIYFLFVITTAIIGIFIYVMTMQKVSIFGVMKAQGISNRYIAKSIIAQTFILGVVGVTLGLLATVLTALPLPAAVPFALEPIMLLIYSVALVLVAVLGGLFSIRTITKIDPMMAIGG